MSSASPSPPDGTSAPPTGSLGQLRIEVPHWSAEVRVVDNLFRPVSLPPLQSSTTTPGAYATEASLPGGVYDVEVRMGDRIAQSSLSVRPGKRPALFSKAQWGELGVATAAPVAGTETARPSHADAAEHWSRTPTWQAPSSGPSRLFVFVRTLEPERFPTFADGLTLREPSLATPITDFQSGVQKDPQQGWVAFTADVPPGCYILGRLKGDDGVPAREQPIYLLPGWETHVFISAREHPSLRTLTLSLARFGQGFRWDDAAALAIEAVFDVLQRGSGGRRLVTKEHFATLIEGEHGNPWLGVLAAYVLVQSLEELAQLAPYWEERQSARDLLREMRQYLARTIGEHPDVAALALPLAGETTPDVPPGTTARSFPNPPLLRLGLKLVQRYATRDMGAIPLGSLTDRVLRHLLANSPWTAWRPLQGEGARPRTAEAQATKRRSGGARPVSEAQVFLQSAPPRAPVFRFEPPAQSQTEALGTAQGQPEPAPPVSINRALRDAALIHVAQELVEGRDLEKLPKEISLDVKQVLSGLLSPVTPEDVSEACGLSLAEAERGLSSLRRSSGSWVVTAALSAVDPAAADSAAADSAASETPETAAIQQRILGYALEHSKSERAGWAPISSADEPAGDEPTAVPGGTTEAGAPGPGGVTPFTIEEAVRGLRAAAEQLELDADRPKADAAPAATRLRALADELLCRAALVAITDPQGHILLGNGALLVFLGPPDDPATCEARRAAYEAAFHGKPAGKSTIPDPQGGAGSWTLHRTVVRAGSSRTVHSYLNVLHLSGAPSITQPELDAVETILARITLSASMYAYGSADNRAEYLGGVLSAAAEMEQLLGGGAAGATRAENANRPAAASDAPQPAGRTAAREASNRRSGTVTSNSLGMKTMASLQERVLARVAEIERKDKELGQEMAKVRGSPGTAAEAKEVAEVVTVEMPAGGTEAAGDEPTGAIDALVQETIVLRTGRPVLAIVRGAARLEFRDKDSEVWKQRLTEAQDRMGPAIQAVGRVELRNNPRFDWVGTGWLVADDVVVTNRHVANEFARSNGGRFDFQVGALGRMEAAIDFLEEIERAEDFTVRVERVLHIEGERGPDVAFLKLRRDSRTLAQPVALSDARTVRDQFIAVIGYPARDSRIPEEDLMDEIFGNIYNKKRFAPGQITGSRDGQLLHDCSTLGGNSGSALIDLKSGAAVGLHFAGRFLETNFAVPAHVVAERLDAVLRGRAKPQPVRQPVRDREVDIAAGGQMGATVSLTIPIRVTVTVGTPTRDGRGASTGGVAAPAPDETGEDADDVEIEAPRDPSEYDDRDGYSPSFLGDGTRVPLPAVSTAWLKDVVTFERSGQTVNELPYRHFSVVMSRSRRLCVFSAVNIDGKQSRKMKRAGWRFDPRIPQDLQILKECYGNAPKFSRGHMTRREDPIWGVAALAAQGNEDSMHATNAVPQMQPFNAGIWLGLEDYALENARQDDMRISVFTGPFLAKNDPIRFGVKIPRSFWKVIAFIHDETGELCATGYTMSQNSFLREEEFVFGQHEMAQQPISTIEARTGLSFGTLAEVDPLAGAEEAPPGALTDFSQIRFV